MKLRFLLSRPVILITVLSLTWAVLFAFDIIPNLRGDYGWRWPYDPVLDLRRLAPIVLGVIVYIPIAIWLLRKRSSASLLIWAIAGSIGLTLAAAYVRNDVLFQFYTITSSGVAGGWHMAATRIRDLGETLHNWPQFMADSTAFSSHMGISPPGTVMVYYTTSSFLARFPAIADSLAGPLRLLQCHNIPLMGNTNAQIASAWLGMLMPLWGSLTILPLYQLGRRVFSEGAARWGVVWWPLIPSFLFFAPLPNTFYPLPALIMIDLLLVGLCRNQPVWVAAAGLLMSALTFLTFTFMPLLLLAGLLTLGIYWIKIRQPTTSLPWHWPIQMGLWFGLGLSVIWLIFYAVTGLGAWNILSAASQAHLTLERPYWPWLILHLNDFFMFTGWPLTLLAGVGVWSITRKLLKKATLTEKDVVILAAALTVIILDLSGTLRGESGRILLFLSPLLLLTAASALNDHRKLGEVLSATQGIILIIMIACLHVLGSEFTPAPSAPPTEIASLPEGLSELPSGAMFGEAVRLNAFSGQIEMQHKAEGQDQAVLALWLKWEPLRQMDVPYYLAFTPVAPNGQVATAATLLQPFQQVYPTTCWKPGDGEMQERIEVPLFNEENGDWWISLSLIDGQTGQTLSVVNPDGSSDHQVGLGPFRYRIQSTHVPLRFTQTEDAIR